MRGENNQPQITELYKKFLVNQFHDILPGSHIHPVYEDAMADYAEIESALDNMIAEKDAQYFNTLNIPRDSLTFVENKNGSSTRLGKRGNWLVPNIPSMSAKTLRAQKSDTSWIRIDGMDAVTPYYAVSFNEDGSIASLYDVALGREWTDGNFNKLRIYDDRPGNYDAWDILPN